jgi:hypothetical protein
MALWPEAVRDAEPLELVETEIVWQLRNDPRMTALVAGRVYTAVPPGTPFPQVLVGSSTGGNFNRLGHAGVDATVTVRASSQVRGTWEVHQIAGLARMILEGLTVTPLGPFRRATWVHDDQVAAVYTDDLAGIVTVHRPVIFRVRVTIA